ncbi:MAG: PocR ligand-binding domain-containing protein [Chloroflexota bacterium]
MHDLLTAREVQELLKLDRTTIYRMLKDGRLEGVKVGQQWRFVRQEVEAILSGAHSAQDVLTQRAADILPLHCIQPIQDIFAEIANVTALTVTPDGELLTEVSNPSPVYQLLTSRESGQRLHRECWQRLVSASKASSDFATCFAGIHAVSTPVTLDGELVAVLIAEQFYVDSPDADNVQHHIEQLATTHHIDAEELSGAMHAIPILDSNKRSLLGSWLRRVADTFEHIGQERAALVGRLQSIAAICTLDG